MLSTPLWHCFSHQFPSGLKGPWGRFGTLHLTNSPEDAEPAGASLAGILAGGAVWAGTRDHRGVALVRCLPTCVMWECDLFSVAVSQIFMRNK